MTKYGVAFNDLVEREYPNILMRKIYVGGNDIIGCVEYYYKYLETRYHGIDILNQDGSIYYSLELPVQKDKIENTVIRIMWSNLQHYRKNNIDSELEKIIKEVYVNEG